MQAVHPAMDCMNKSMAEQSHLLEKAQRVGKEVIEDILALLPAREDPYLTPVVPHSDLLTPALVAAQTHTATALGAVNEQLSGLITCHITPEQVGVFLAFLLQVMCSC